jgi:hypothetical protein
MTVFRAIPIALAAILVAPMARADEKAAIALFEEGRKLAREGHYGAAVPKLLASLAEQPSVGTLLNLADCYEKLGKTASAFERFREATRLAVAKKDGRIREAEARATALEPRLSRLTIAVPDNVRVRDLEVRRDGELVPDSAWEMHIAVDPGAHTIEIKAPGYKTRVAQANVAARSDDAVYTVTALEPVDVPVPVVREPPSSGPSAQQIGAAVALGAGALAVGAGTFFGIRSMTLHADVKSLCPAYPACTPDVADDAISKNRDATRAATVSTVAFVAGGALVAAGAVLFLTAPRSGPRVAARLGPGAAFVEGTW